VGYPHSVLDVLPAQGSEGILQGIFRSAPTKILFAGTDFLLGDVPPPGWQVSMTGFRSFGLRLWRRRAVRGYFNWRRNNIPWQSNLATPAQMVRWRMGMVFGSV